MALLPRPLRAPLSLGASRQERQILALLRYEAREGRLTLLQAEGKCVRVVTSLWSWRVHPDGELERLPFAS